MRRVETNSIKYIPGEYAYTNGHKGHPEYPYTGLSDEEDGYSPMQQNRMSYKQKKYISYGLYLSVFHNSGKLHWISVPTDTHTGPYYSSSICG